MRHLAITPSVLALLHAGAPVCVGVSGGKDSHAVAWELSVALRDYAGPKLLIHADLGSVEWADSLPACQRLADRIGWELVTTRRAAGGMMERWQSRWESSITRYLDLRTVALVLPWSTPALRFCTSELKVDPITRKIRERFPKQPVLSITGIRAEESTARAKQAIDAPAAKLPPGSLVWRPIHGYLLPDVWEAIADSGVPAHEAYRMFGSSRVSCRFCILANEADLRASLSDPAAHAIYRRMCELELTSAFSFQGKWLTRLAPDLIPDGTPRLAAAIARAEVRKSAESWIPPHLAFTKGWPHCVPDAAECQRLADMRSRICDLYGWHSPYLDAATVRDRYQYLFDHKPTKKAA